MYSDVEGGTVTQFSQWIFTEPGLGWAGLGWAGLHLQFDDGWCILSARHQGAATFSGLEQ